MSGTHQESAQVSSTVVKIGVTTSTQTTPDDELPPPVESLSEKTKKATASPIDDSKRPADQCKYDPNRTKKTKE